MVHLRTGRLTYIVRPGIFPKVLKKGGCMPNQKRNFRNHLTIIVGPPDQKAIDQNIGNWTNDANDTIDNLWIEHVSSYVDLLTEHRAPEYISELERIFTHFLQEGVRIEGSFVGQSWRGNEVVPAIIIYEKDITDVNGIAIPIERFTKDIRDVIGRFLISLMKPKWIHTSISVAI